MRAVWLVVVVVGCGSEPPSREAPPIASPSHTAPSSGSGTSAGTTNDPQSSRDKDSRTTQPFQDQAEDSPKPAEATVLTYRATWANVISETAGCWFFSGPDGRDTPLGERVVVRVENSHGWMSWDKASFEGTWGSSSIDVFRLAKHSYGGAWVVSERLVGTVKEKGIHAKYTYNECAEGTKCPGECRITADVLLVEER